MAQLAPAIAVSGQTNLAALRSKVSEAVKKTLSKLPEVVAVLWSTVNGQIRVVTILDDSSDEAILRVADQELALMDEMEEFQFEFRMADREDAHAFIASGYVPIVEKRDHDNAAPA